MMTTLRTTAGTSKTALVTGASSGVAAAAEALLARGHTSYASARASRTNALAAAGARVLALDDTSMTKAVEEIPRARLELLSLVSDRALDAWTRMFACQEMSS